MPTEGFNFPEGAFDDPYRALRVAAEVLRLHPETTAAVGPWDDQELFRTRRIEVEGSDDVISLIALRLQEAGLSYTLDPRRQSKIGDGRYIRYAEEVL